MASGDVQDRYNREWLQLGDTRKQRGFDNKAAERREREFVDPDTGTTVTAVGDNDNGVVTIQPK